MPLPPIPDAPPLLNAIWAAYIGVVATILIGIFFTKDDKRNFENIVSNIVSFALLLATVQFTWFTLLIMGLYLVAGIIIAIEQVKKWFFLFGSKTYGSLALMVLIAAHPRAFFGFTLSELEFPITWTVVEYMGLILIGWVILASVAHATCYYYYKKPTPKKKKTDTAADMKASLKALFGGKISKKKKGKSRQSSSGKRKSGSSGSRRRSSRKR